MYDMNLRDIYRSADVTRWGIVKVAHSQSVAEHSFQVAMIANRLCDLGEFDGSIRMRCVWHALTHDLPEVLTGDLASPLKAMLGKQASDNLKSFESEITALGRKCTESDAGIRDLVKAADLIEAIAFLSVNAMTDHGHRVKAGLMDSLERRFRHVQGLWQAIERVLYELLHGPEKTLDDIVEAQ